MKEEVEGYAISLQFCKPFRLLQIATEIIKGIPKAYKPLALTKSLKTNQTDLPPKIKKVKKGRQSFLYLT